MGAEVRVDRAISLISAQTLGLQSVLDGCVGDCEVGPQHPDRMAGGNTALINNIAFDDMARSNDHLR